MGYEGKSVFNEIMDFGNNNLLYSDWYVSNSNNAYVKLNRVI